MGNRTSVSNAALLATACLAMCPTAWGQASSQPASQPAAQTQAARVDTAYPGLASSILTYATLADLPKGTLLESGPVRLTEADLAGQMDKAPPEVRKQLEKNGFYLLEQMAGQKLVMELARQQAPGASTQASQQAQAELVRSYFAKIVEPIKVTDAEVKDFYENNKDMCGGASLDSMKGQLTDYVLQQKQQAAAEEHVRTLGKRMPIQVNTAWVAAQAQLARDNPVDKARSSGKPSMVDFGASGCRPCDMMTPILKDLEKKYDGKASILFVHVREEQVLAGRYGVQSIPTQVFFDKDGREVYRHTGFYPQAEIEKHMAKMGVQ
jgi:thiol-disulfide isomerase/thioredoxin